MKTKGFEGKKGLKWKASTSLKKNQRKKNKKWCVFTCNIQAKIRAATYKGRENERERTTTINRMPN